MVGPRFQKAPRARLVATLAAVGLVALGASGALGYWTGVGSDGSGTGAAAAAAVKAGAAPTATDAGAGQVVVAWGSSSLSNGIPVDGYVVTRYAVSTGLAATIGAGCAGTIALRTCTESTTPVGNWQYTVTPVLAARWRGLESQKSGSVDTTPGTMTLQTSLFGGTVAPLPATVSGSVSGFSLGEVLRYTLDGVTIPGSAAVVGVGGTASFTLTIPAGTGDGPHTVAVQGLIHVASVGILVDTIAPTIHAFVTPTPNAAGWNSTSPVEVNATVDDGNGSGIAYAKYTDDNSNPLTSPTAHLALGPLSIAVTTTLKFFLADLAGNTSPVQTLQVNIDTTPPYFTVAFVNVQGGVYLGATDPNTGIPGTAYYRGAAAGSLQFLMTALPSSGSPAIAAGFSALPPDAFGFTFASTSVTTPVGGPFLSSPLSWVAGSTSTPAGTISLTNAAGNTFGLAGPLYNDSTPPTGGSVAASGLVGTGGRYSQSLTVNLGLAKGTDAASGLADGTGQSDVPAALLRASAPLSSANGVADGSCGAYSAYARVGVLDPAPTVSDTVPADHACYRYEYVVADHVGNLATYTSADIKVIAVASGTLTPTTGTLSAVSGASAQSVSGSTLFYNPLGAGSFNVDTTVSAAYSGISQVTFPAIAGFTGGGALTTPTSGTTFRRTYAWSGNLASPSPGPQAISAANNVGETATNAAAFSVVKDATGPTGGSVDARGLAGTGGRYSTSTALSMALAPGVDAGSGLAASGAQLLRATAGLISDGTVNGVCGSYGAYGQVGANDPVSPVSDVVPVDRSCYRYAYVVSDKVGNQTTYTSPDVKVEAPPPPTPALSFSVLNGAYWSGVGTTVYYTPAAAGGFRLTAASSDLFSGTTGFGFPTLPAGWSGTPGGSGVENYTWSPSPTAPSGGQSVTSTNNAGGSAAASFTAVPDGAAPTGGSISYTNGFSAARTASISLVAPSDAGSGLAAGSSVLQRAQAPLAGGTCGAFGAFATVATSPTSPYTDSVTSGNCYEYRYVVADNLGNAATLSSQSVLKVDSSPPTHALSLASPVGAYLTGSTLYYASAAAGSFKLLDALAGNSPVASVTYPLIGATGWTHPAETVSTPSGGPYASSAFSWTANPASPSAYVVTGQNSLGTASTSSLTFTGDATAPTGGSVAVTGLGGAGGRYSTSTALHVTFAPGTDSGSGLALSGAMLLRGAATLSSTNGVTAGACGPFGAYAQVGVAGPTSPVTDTVPAANACYRYEYLVPDQVGNTAAYTTDVKVEPAAPAALTPTAATITPVTGLLAQQVIGSTVYYNAALAGSFTVESDASDLTSGSAQVAFPAISGFAGGGVVTTPTAGTTFRTTYSWSSNLASPSPGAQSVTATDGAGLVATNASAFSVVADAGPAGGSVDATGLAGTGARWSTSLTLNVAFTKGTSASGFAPGAQLLRAAATLTSGVCGTYGAYALLATDPSSTKTDTVPTDGTCYHYQYVVPDALGVKTTYTSPDVKVDTGAPTISAYAGSALVNIYFAGNQAFYLPSAAGHGTLTVSASDPVAGIASVSFPVFPAGWTMTPGSLGVMTYSYTANPTPPSGALNVTAVNGAGTSSAPFGLAIAADGTPPSGGAINYSAGSQQINVTFQPGTDAGSGLNLSSAVLQRATQPACSGGFGAFTTIAAAPTSPYKDTAVTSGSCYQYRYVISDNVGNQATYASASIARVN